MKEITIKCSDEKILTFNTKSKLPVYMYVNEKKQNTYISLVVKYGSNYTEFKCNGVNYNVPTGTAHFLEHLKFHLKDNDVNDLFLDLGSDTNAYTSIRETVYEVFANENIYEATKLLLDFVYDDYFSKKILESERGIILEEANLKKDDITYEFYKEYLNNFFINSNSKNIVIGKEKDIKSISLDDIKLVFDYFYRPENMFMVITGNFDPEIMKKTICENEKDRKFKDIGKVEVIEKKEVKKLATKRYEYKSKKCKNLEGRLTIKCLDSDFKNYTKKEALIALRCIFGANFGRTSDFNEYLMQTNLATQFSVSVSLDKNAIAINIFFQSDDVDKVEELIKEKLKNMTLTDEELNRIKNISKASFIMQFDNIYGVAYSIISSIIDDDKVSPVDMEILNKITKEEVLNVYKCVDINNIMMGLLKPIKEKKKQ